MLVTGRSFLSGSAAEIVEPWHRLYLFPLPHGHGSFLPIFFIVPLIFYTVLFAWRFSFGQFAGTWAADVRRTRHVGNFRGWKDHDECQEAFERLMWDLKAGDRGSGG